jgi:hypothetical protein
MGARSPPRCASAHLRRLPRRGRGGVAVRVAGLLLAAVALGRAEEALTLDGLREAAEAVPGVAVLGFARDDLDALQHIDDVVDAPPLHAQPLCGGVEAHLHRRRPGEGGAGAVCDGGGDVRPRWGSEVGVGGSELTSEDMEYSWRNLSHRRPNDLSFLL